MPIVLLFSATYAYGEMEEVKQTLRKALQELWSGEPIAAPRKG